MAVSLTTVTGSIDFPNGSTPAQAVIRFRLTSRDSNGSNLFFGVSEFPVGSDGSFSAAVQTTDGMDERTFYEVTVAYFDGAAGQQSVYLLGLVKVPTSGSSVTLSSILPIVIPSGATSIYRTKRGDTISFGIVMQDQYGRPLNMTGFAISAGMRQGDAALVMFEVTSVSLVDGRFDVTLAAGLSGLLALGAHDFEIKISNGVRVVRTITGTIIVEQEVIP